jgi:nitrous oxide reductase
MSGRQTDLKRRKFLLTVGLGGAGAAAGAVGGRAMLANKEQAQTATARGYRLSAHVQNYYRTTRV